MKRLNVKITYIDSNDLFTLTKVIHEKDVILPD